MYKSNSGSLLKQSFPSISDNRKKKRDWVFRTCNNICVKKILKDLWETLIGLHKVIFSFKNFIIKIFFCLYIKAYNFIPYFLHRQSKLVQDALCL